MALKVLRSLLSTAIATASVLCTLAAPATAPPPAAPASARVFELKIDGEIEPVLAEYIVNGIKQAEDEHADLILLTIDTPGGLDTSMRSIISAILASRVPVAAYVTPTGSRAASAGFFILLSADVAAMSPGTETGAASPVFMMFGQTVKIDETMYKKVLNDITAFLRSYASKRGRNVDLAVTAVTDAKAFSDKEALDGKLIDIVASSPQDLLSKLDGRTIARFDGSTIQLALSHSVVETHEMTLREKLFYRIVQPDVFFILLIIGVLGLYTEFNHPGLFAPGVIGGIALVLALFAMHMLPVNITGLLLILLALTFFVLEAKFPTHGILGVGGVLAMVLGALLLIRSPMTGMGVNVWIALGVAIPFALIVIFLMRLVLRSRQWKQSTGKEELMGELGEVTVALSAGGSGMVLMHGELWQARASGGQSIAKGARVRVKSVKGLTLVVDPVEEASPASR